MYSYLFKNPKAAIGFVILTVVSAVSMIGTTEKQGVLTETVDRIEERSTQYDAWQANPSAPATAATSELKESESVFGDFEETGDPPALTAPSPGEVIGGAIEAPLSPDAIIVGRGTGPGLPVPGPAEQTE